MSLEDEIHDKLVADASSVLENNLERVQDLLQIYEDETIEIKSPYRQASGKVQALIYLIGQRFAKEGNVADEQTLSTEYFYERIDKGKRTVRKYLQQLRDAGFATKEGQSEHRVVVENLPNALDWIEGEVE
ncbi:hypothetical protein ACFQH6_03530 [Halobacteriaceae archaeon GCM10025711]